MTGIRIGTFAVQIALTLRRLVAGRARRAA